MSLAWLIQDVTWRHRYQRRSPGDNPNYHFNSSLQKKGKVENALNDGMRMLGYRTISSVPCPLLHPFQVNFVAWTGGLGLSLNVSTYLGNCLLFRFSVAMMRLELMTRTFHNSLYSAGVGGYADPWGRWQRMVPRNRRRCSAVSLAL